MCLGVQLPAFPGLIVKAKYATEHRCGIVVSGPGLSDDVSGTDPLKDNLPLQVRTSILPIVRTCCKASNNAQCLTTCMVRYNHRTATILLMHG